MHGSTVYMLANDVMSTESTFSKIVILCTDCAYWPILLGLFGLFPPNRVKRRDDLISHSYVCTI